MSDPILDADGLQLSMVYPISDFITHDMVKVELYNRNCSEGQVRVEEYFNATLISPSVDQVQGDGTGLALMNVTIKVDPASFNEAPPDVSEQWYDTASQISAGRVQFCILAQLHIAEDENAVVDGSETVVTVDYDLTDGFSIEVSVEDKQNDVTLEEDFGPDGYFCDNDGIELNEEQMALLGRAGSELSVCVVPNEKAQQAGLGLKQIDSFAWVRVDPSGGRVEQIAVENGQVPGNGLTEMVCDDFGCGFKSILKADFFVENVPPPTEQPSAAPTEQPSAAPTTAPTIAPNVAGEIRSVYNTNLCLDYNLDNGNLYMLECHGMDNQKWDWDPSTGMISSVGAWSNICMREDFTNIRGDPCNNVAEMKWTLTEVGENIYTITQPRDGLYGLCMDLSLEGDNNIYMSSCHGGNNQQFLVPPGWTAKRRELLQQESPPELTQSNERRALVNELRESAVQQFEQLLESRHSQTGRELQEGGGVTTIGGIGVATVKFPGRRYRRNLRADVDGWEEYEEYERYEQRLLQVGSGTGSFNLELQVQTGPYLGFYDRSSASVSRGFRSLLALGTLLVIWTLAW